MPSTDMNVFKDTLQASKRIICVAGAGLSAASGIPTFRGAGGMWRKYDATSLATPEAFEQDPSRVWQFYHYRREKALQVKPNAAHYALAMLSLPRFRNSIAPDSTFSLITQNVDELSHRALKEVKARYEAPPGSERDTSAVPDPSPPELLGIHGSVFDVKCSRCEHVQKNYDSPICPALKGTEQIYETESKEPEPHIPARDLPRCSHCGSLARPGVVWFGERVPSVSQMHSIAKKADLCLVVGTSSQVYPAAGVAGLVKHAGGKVAVFNLDRSAGDERADFLFLGSCEETLPAALGIEVPSRYR